MASKKDFSAMNTAPVYNTIADATADTKGETQKKPRKVLEAYNPERAAEMSAAGTTRGRKGCAMHRINMAFTDEVHDYIKTMARVCGMSITEFTNRVFENHMEENRERYERAKAERELI